MYFFLVVIRYRSNLLIISLSKYQKEKILHMYVYTTNILKTDGPSVKDLNSIRFKYYFIHTEYV